MTDLHLTHDLFAVARLEKLVKLVRLPQDDDEVAVHERAAVFGESAVAVPLVDLVEETGLVVGDVEAPGARAADDVCRQVRQKLLEEPRLHHTDSAELLVLHETRLSVTE